MADQIDWNNPAERLALIERVGIDEYRHLLEEHFKRTTEITVNGHAIRRIPSRFGELDAIGTTGRAFLSLPEAVNFAESYPSAAGNADSEDTP